MDHPDAFKAKPMTTAELRHHCSRLYGAGRWQTALAKEIRVNDRTVRRWAAGDSPVPQSVAHAVRLMAFLDEMSWLGEWRKFLEEEFLVEEGF
jgi:hypothetical protein